MPTTFDDDGVTPPDRPGAREPEASVEHVTGEIRILRESAVTWQRPLLIIGGAATVIVGGSYAAAKATVDGGMGAMRAELAAQARGDAAQQKATQDRLDYLKDATLEARESATAAKKAAEQSRAKLSDVDAKLDAILATLKRQNRKPE